jgi:hypothetical protein
MRCASRSKIALSVSRGGLELRVERLWLRAHFEEQWLGDQEKLLLEDKMLFGNS